MPTKLYYFKTKKELLRWCRERGYSLDACRDAWTGPGYYYARSRTHISKHVEHLDKRRGKKIGRGPWRHLHDSFERLVRHTGKAVGKRVKRLKRRGVKTRKAEKIVLARAIKESRELPRGVHRIAGYLWEQIPGRYKRGRRRKWTYIAVLALAKTIYDKARSKGIDWRQYDWVNEIDWSEGYREAKRTVEKLLGSTKSYDRLSNKEIKEMLRYYEQLARHGKVEVEIELEPWEIKQLF